MTLRCRVPISNSEQQKGHDMKRAMMISFSVALALTSGLAEAKQSRKHHVVRTAQPEHIACTKYGCYPVPRNCTPHTQLNWWGNPTGYDAIACR
jgi:hypothetical protein